MAKRPSQGAKSDAKVANVATPAPPPETSVQPKEDPYAQGWDYLLVNGPVDERMMSGVLGQITKSETKNEALLMSLVTYGGVANDAFRIGRALQSVYGNIAVFIPSFCKSAGTLLACSANTIIMSPFGELGPLDVQVLRRDELFERRSGLITTYALEQLTSHSFELFEHFMLSIKRRGGSVSFKMASEIAGKVTSEIMKHVYEHVNVEGMGEDARNLRVASEYANRLDKKFRNLRPDAIEKLVHGYVSHDFVIDWDEAKALFHRVELPSQTVFDLLSDNRREMVVPQTSGVIVKFLTPSRSTAEDDDHVEQADVASVANPRSEENVLPNGAAAGTA